MILQPIVENAIRHGIGARARGGSVRIDSRREQGVLCLVVEDDGPGAGSSPDGIGLANTRERLARLYDGAHRLELDSSERGTRVVIELPFTAAPP
jgi:sensor histidine kinase YesM